MVYTDRRIPLTQCNGANLCLGHTEFEEESLELLGRGGTCLVYDALQKDSCGRSRRVILKEFYPDLPDSHHWRDTGSGQLNLPRQERIEDLRSRFFRSYELFKELFNEEELNLYTVQAQSRPAGNGTDYMIVDYGSGMTLERYLTRKPGMYDFLSRMLVLARVLEKLHRRGFVHMDLKPVNLLCYADHDLVKLLDTDSLLEKKRFLGKPGEEILSGSPGYTAPEVHQLGEALETGWSNAYFERQWFAKEGHRADLYAFGVILQRYFWQDCPEDADLETCLRKRESYLSGKTIRLVQTLLEKTLAVNPESRYANMAEAARTLEELLPLVNPGKPYLAQKFSANGYPVLGREQVLARMEALLQAQPVQGSRILCLSGIGGVGKSVTAREYAWEHRQEYDVITEVAALSAEDAAARLTVMNWEPDPALSEKERRASCRKMVAHLCSQHRTLILVHDYDVSEDDMGIWRELNCDILLTSRHDWSGSIPTIHLRCADLDAAQAEAVFAQYYLECNDTDQYRRLSGILEQEKKALTKLVRQVDGHPLTLKLLARYMTYVPGQELGPKKALEEKIFAQDSPREIREDAGLMHNVWGHLSRLFRYALEKRSFREQEILTLCDMIQIPSEYGISPDRFCVWCDREADWLERLRRRGWLEYLPWQQDVLQEDAGPGVYVMPRVVQEVLWKESEIGLRVAAADDYIGQYSAVLYDRFRKEGHFPRRMAFAAHIEQLMMMPQKASTEYLQLLLLVLELCCNRMDMEKGNRIISRYLALYDRLPPEDRENPELKEAWKMLRRSQLLKEGQLKAFLAAGRKKRFSSLAEAAQEIGASFEGGQVEEALAMAKRARRLARQNAPLWDRICYRVVLVRLYSGLGLFSRAEKEYRCLCDLYREYGDRDASMDKLFYSAACDYVPLALEMGCSGQTWNMVYRLQDSAGKKLGPEHITTAQLYNWTADACVLRSDWYAARYREKAIAHAQNPIEELTWMLHLVLDYGSREPERRDKAFVQALKLYGEILRQEGRESRSRQMQELAAHYLEPGMGRLLGELTGSLAESAIPGIGMVPGMVMLPGLLRSFSDREKKEQPAEYWIGVLFGEFYYTAAADAVEAELIPTGLGLLRHWLRLVRRIDSCYIRRDAHMAAGAEVFHRFGLKEEADRWRRQAGSGSPQTGAGLPEGEYARLERLAARKKVHIRLW